MCNFAMLFTPIISFSVYSQIGRHVMFYVVAVMNGIVALFVIMVWIFFPSAFSSDPTEHEPDSKSVSNAEKPS